MLRRRTLHKHLSTILPCGLGKWMYMEYIQPDNHILTEIRYGFKSNHQTFKSPLIPLRLKKRKSCSDRWCPKSWLLKLQCESESSGELGKTDFWDPALRFADSLGLGWSLHVCIFNKLPSDADAAGLGPHLNSVLLHLCPHVSLSPGSPFFSLWAPFHELAGHVHVSRPLPQTRTLCPNVLMVYTLTAFSSLPRCYLLRNIFSSLTHNLIYLLPTQTLSPSPAFPVCVCVLLGLTAF